MRPFSGEIDEKNSPILKQRQLSFYTLSRNFSEWRSRSITGKNRVADKDTGRKDINSESPSSLFLDTHNFAHNIWVTELFMAMFLKYFLAPQL